MNPLTSPKRDLTPSEKAANAAAKRARIKEAKDAARADGWRLVGKTTECFYPKADELTSNKSFLDFNICAATQPSRFNIFRQFVTDKLMEQVKARWKADNFKLGAKHKSGSAKIFTPNLRYMWQTLAIQIRLLGSQKHRQRITLFKSHWKRSQWKPEIIF